MVVSSCTPLQNGNTLTKISLPNVFNLELNASRPPLRTNATGTLHRSVPGCCWSWRRLLMCPQGVRAPWVFLLTFSKPRGHDDAWSNARSENPARNSHCCIVNHFFWLFLLCAKKVYHYFFFDSVQCNPRRNKTNTYSVAQKRSIDLQLLFLDGTGFRDQC